MQFEWDDSKNPANRNKHRISLDEACALRSGPVLEVPSNYLLENRKLAIGKISGKHWTIIFINRGANIRLISARRSRENEMKIYNEKNKHQES